MKQVALVLLPLAFLTAGCASPDRAPLNERATDMEYSTGSNVPRRRGTNPDARVMSREEFERAQEMSRPITREQ
jgi:hypothetical protein